MKLIIVVLLAAGLCLGGCICPSICSSDSSQPSPLPNCSEITLPIAFERIVWSLPVGILIKYPPNIPNHQLVLVLRSVEEIASFRHLSIEYLKQCTSYAIIRTLSGESIHAFCFACPNNLVGTCWYFATHEGWKKIEQLENILDITLCPKLAP